MFQKILSQSHIELHRQALNDNDLTQTVIKGFVELTHG